MQVRVLGGKTFCSRTGTMVVGEMKNKFLLVDLERVIHGSYRWAVMSFNSLLLYVSNTVERDVTSCLCTLQPHMDRRPPAPAADHCSKWPSCWLIWQGVQDPFCCLAPRLGHTEGCRHSRRCDSAAETPLKYRVSETFPFGTWDYQPSISIFWLPPRLGSHGGCPQRRQPGQSSWSTWGNCGQGNTWNAVW